MRNRILAYMFAAAAIVACNKTEAPEGNSTNTFTVSTENLQKTSLGPEVSGSRSILWKEGDKISINGLASQPLEKSYEGGTSATFYFEGILSSPYNILYPAQATETGVVIPATQSYVSGSFDSASCPMYGSSNGSNTSLKNLSTILRFGFTGSAVLDRVELLTSNGEAICGTYELEKEGGIFTGKGAFDSESASRITLSFGNEGLALAAEAKEVFIPVIQGYYAKGFQAKVIDKDGGCMTLSFFGTGRTLSGEKLLSFPNKAFAAGSTAVIVCLGEYDTEHAEFSDKKIVVRAEGIEGITSDVQGVLRINNSVRNTNCTSSETVVSATGADFVYEAAIDPSATDFKLVSVFPAKAITVDGVSATVNVPAVQTTDCTIPDPNANIYFGATSTMSSLPGTAVTVPFAGAAAVLNINVTNVPADEKVISIAFTSNDAYLTGSATLDLAEGTMGEYTEDAKTINTAVKDWAAGKSCPTVCIPGTVNGFSASVVTDKNIYNYSAGDILTLVKGSATDCTIDLQSATKKETLRIFLIGNSFTQDACHQLPPVICGAGITNIEVTQCYYGGRTVPEYNDGWETSSDYTKHTALPGEDKMTDTKNTNLKTVAESQEWDIVCIQEHTGNYRAWEWNATEKRHISELMEKVAATQTKRPLFYYIMSQTYYDMEKIGTASRPYETWKDQAGMFDVIVAFGKKVMEELPFDGIIATGTTLQNLRQTELMNSMCLTRDGYHMDYGISRYAAACCLYETMIYPRYGISLDVNTYRSSESSTTSGSYRTPITDKNVPIAIQAARDAVARPYEVTYQTHRYGDDGGAGTNPGTQDFGNL